MSRRVPRLDGGDIMEPAEDVEGAGVEHEVGGEFGILAEPARGEGAAHVAVGEDEGVAGHRAGAGDDEVGAGGDLREGFAAGARVSEDVPAGNFFANLFGGEALILAVIEFAEVVLDLGAFAKAGEFAGLAGALHGTGEDEGEGQAGEAMTKSGGEGAAAVGEREVGAGGVTAIAGPLGFAVADEEEAGHGEKITKFE
jgi:hypothetical protein